ncbi:hypothetical protein [Streptomyces sp. Root1295]|uniref:hypothetical protein n=1 Tax=Streptomyces sp. Root1295 TaxID=1736448 RepID=UPI0018E2BDB6|nr:hypothetical protein [Streptomyces sp. Root1295]
MIEEIKYEVDVEAEDRDEAEEAAVELVCDEPDEYYTDTLDRTTTDTVRLREAVAA